jgi:hypothetical protein
MLSIHRLFATAVLAAAVLAPSVQPARAQPAAAASGPASVAAATAPSASPVATLAASAPASAAQALAASAPQLTVERGPKWEHDDKRWTPKDWLTAVSVVVALMALTFSAYTRWRTANQAYYAHLSKVWYDLRKEEAKHPEWMDPNRTSMHGLGGSNQPPPAPSAYDAQAWSCWALAEDWYETYAKRALPPEAASALPGRLLSNELAQFEGAVRSVTELHWAWMLRPENRCRFDEHFVAWVVTRFLNNRVEKMLNSPIAGTGVKTRHALKAGQFLGFLDGMVTAARSQHTLQIGETIHLLLGEPMRFLNHADTPNAVVRGRSLFAYRDIPAGGEVTIDYACTEDEFTLGPGGGKLGFAVLTPDERAARADRLHVWLIDRALAPKPPATQPVV